MGRRWIAEKKREHYYMLAKKAGFRSRAAYKLLQLNEKYNIIRKGDYILDLGAAPGGWSQAAALIAGESGFVLGIDISKIEPFGKENICFIQGDITKKETIEKIKEASKNRKFDAVISDASPNISGVWSIDHEVSVELAMHAFKIAKSTNSIKDKLLFLKIDYYQILYEIAEKISEFLKNYVKIEIDFANLEIYLNLRIFEEKIEISRFIKNGNIKIEKFLEEESLKKAFISEYKKDIDFVEEKIEIEKYRIIIEHLKKGRIKPFGIDKIISFYIAREIEIKNLQNLALSKFYKQEEDFLKRISMKPYQYKEI